jgi:hypothetical protein
MRENAAIVVSLLMRSCDPSPLLPHPSIYSCCLATDEARRGGANDERLVTSQLVSARFESSRRKHCFIYCYIIAGACFDVTVLSWRKYATIFSIREYCRNILQRFLTATIFVIFKTEYIIYWPSKVFCSETLFNYWSRILLCPKSIWLWAGKT